MRGKINTAGFLPAVDYFATLVFIIKSFWPAK